ncbi:MAG: hypothetical protein V4677_16085 [Bacteroidota bacterium]
MKTLFTICIVMSACCGCTTVNTKQVQSELFGKSFNYEDIQSIEIVEIEHPMLGGIVSVQILTPAQQQLFIQRLQNLEKDGPYKCANKNVIRIILANDTLRLKTCGEKISGKTSDWFYSLPGNEPIISDLIK